MKTLLLIDANSLIHRSFHALPPFTSPDGKPTGALYGVAGILLKIWREEKPEYAAALFDRPEPTFRKKEFKEYKAQRPAAPDELISQIIAGRGLFQKFGIKFFEKPGFEADDLIATLAEKFRKERDVRVVILTGDLDTLQLVEGEKVVVRTFKKGISDTFIYDENAVRERYGLGPAQMPDYKAFVGDPSDNIKGIPGIGPKTAAGLLQKFGNIRNLYANLQEEQKLREKLRAAEQDVEFFKRLVTLDRHVPIEIKNLNGLEIREDTKNLSDYFLSLGFQSLLKRIGGQAEIKPAKEAAAKVLPLKTAASEQSSIFDAVSPEKKLPVQAAGHTLFITGIPQNAKGLKDLTSSNLKVGFDLKQTLKSLWLIKGKDMAPPYFDLGVAFWLLDPDFKNYTPESVMKKFLREEWAGSFENLKDLFGFARKKLRGYQLSKVFEEIEMPVLRILGEMENNGILINVAELTGLEEKIESKLKELTEEIYKSVGEEFNVNSPKQVGAILERILPLNNNKTVRTPGGQRSTRAETLEKLKDSHPAVPLLLEYREAFKTQSTYVKPFRELLSKDARLRTTFVQTGTATGRLSSQSPNLQNIPRDSEWAKELRSVVQAQDGFSLAAFDYSQVELRILAVVSEDPGMVRAFKENLDIHRATASKVFGVALEEVTSEMRQMAKTMNFGLIYGMGAAAFQKVSGLKREEAEKFIKTYFEEFSLIPAWQEKTRANARTFGYVETKTGRRRYLPNIISGSPQYVAEAERAAINQPIQGFAADIIKLAMIRTKEALEERKWWDKEAKLILSIHDELLFEVRDSIINDTLPLVKEVMENVCDLEVPLKVETYVGKNWAMLK